MSLVHLAPALLRVVPVPVFRPIHFRNPHNRPNPRAVRIGYILFGPALVPLLSGLALMWFGFIEITGPRVRSPIYWAHVVTLLLAV